MSGSNFADETRRRMTGIATVGCVRIAVQLPWARARVCA